MDDLKAKLAVQEAELKQKNENADKLIQVVGVETEKVSKEKAIADEEEIKVEVINKVGPRGLPEGSDATRRRDWDRDICTGTDVPTQRILEGGPHPRAGWVLRGLSLEDAQNQPSSPQTAPPPQCGQELPPPPPSPARPCPIADTSPAFVNFVEAPPLFCVWFPFGWAWRLSLGPHTG